MSLVPDHVTNDYSVELNFVGAELNPDKVSEILGLDPMKSARTGEPRRNGRSNGAQHDQGFWAYEITDRDDQNECRDHQLLCLVDSIEPHMERLRSEAGIERVYFYFTLSSFIGLLNIRLRPETLRRLGQLDADLYISCFDCFDPNHAFFNNGVEVPQEETGKES